jgi:hypothetical protein
VSAVYYQLFHEELWKWIKNQDFNFQSF